MPREGKKTLAGTSTTELIAKLIEKYIQEHQHEATLLEPKLSKAKVIEIAVLQFLNSKGVLDKFLADFGYSDAQLKSVKERLQAVS